MTDICGVVIGYIKNVIYSEYTRKIFKSIEFNQINIKQIKQLKFIFEEFRFEERSNFP